MVFIPPFIRAKHYPVGKEIHLMNEDTRKSCLTSKPSIQLAIQYRIALVNIPKAVQIKIIPTKNM